MYSRPDKLDDVETVLYEVDMLRFSICRLVENKFCKPADQWVFLEAFLLHYRNLIEFFGKPSPIADSDLSIRRPKDFWRKNPPDSAALRSMTAPDLWSKYDSRRNPESISKYLHHCTKHRVIKKKWNVSQMYEDLLPVIEKFESLLPKFKPATGG